MVAYFFSEDEFGSKKRSCFSQARWGPRKQRSPDSDEGMALHQHRMLGRESLQASDAGRSHVGSRCEARAPVEKPR